MAAALPPPLPRLLELRMSARGRGSRGRGRGRQLHRRRAAASVAPGEQYCAATHECPLPFFGLAESAPTRLGWLRHKLTASRQHGWHFSYGEVEALAKLLIMLLDPVCERATASRGDST